MQKELVIALAEAEEELEAAVNAIMAKHGLPCYLLEPIAYKIHRKLIDGKKAELEQAEACAAKTKEAME